MRAGIHIGFGTVTVFRITVFNDQESKFLFSVEGPLIKVKEENEKVSLKLNISKTKVMASGPITS